MKRSLVAAAAVLVVNVAFASTINVQDQSDKYSLYQIVNELCGTVYTSSNEMLADLGTVSGEKFATSNSYLEWYSKQAWHGHDFGLVDSETGEREQIYYSSAKMNNIREFGFLDDRALPDMDNFYFNLKVDISWAAGPNSYWDLNSTGEHFSTGTPYDSILAASNERFLVIDITSIYKFAEEGKTYWLFAVEDGNDFSYDDYVAVISNVKNVNAVPEPTTMALMGLGGVFLAARKRVLARRKK